MYGNKTSTDEKIIFTSETETKQYLEDLFSNLNEVQEFNIYLHQINGFRDNMTNLFGKDIMLSKLNNLIKTGLNLSYYSSLSGTSILQGSTKNIDVDSVLNYDYYNEKDKVVCVIAIPKYMKIDNELVEYSSYKNVEARCISEELREKYLQKIGHVPDLRHRKGSLFDAVKQFDNLPKEYMLGVLMTNSGKNEYEFVKLNSHYAFLSQEKQDAHDKHVATKIKKLYKKYNTTDTEEIIVKEYMNLEKYYEQEDMMEI